MGNVVYGENVQSICRICGVAVETVAHIVLECSKLAQKENEEVRHDSVVKMLHWKLCEKWRFNKARKWYIHKPEKVSEYEDCKVLSNFPIQTEKTIEHNRPGITVLDSKINKCLLIDTECPFDTRTEKKEEEKCPNYSEFKYEI